MKRFDSARLSEVAIVVVMVVAALGASLNVIDQLRALASKALVERYAYNGLLEPLHRWSNFQALGPAGFIKSLRDGLTLSPESPLQGTQRQRVIALLRDLGDLPADAKRKSAVVVPKTQVSFFWGELLLRSDDSILPACASAPFLVPAISGVALLDGFPPEECRATAYGYQYYPRFGRREHSWKNGFDDWCARAVGMGITQLFVLTLDGADVSAATVACRGGGGTVVDGSMETNDSTSRVVRNIGNDGMPAVYWTSEASQASEFKRGHTEVATMTLDFAPRPGAVALEIPFWPGPRPAGLELRLEDANSGEVLARFNVQASASSWAVWRVAIPEAHGRLRLRATDGDASADSWLRVGMPRALQADELAVALPETR
jgi:hypothetical protein